MELDIYQVDAFARALFRGNPAAVVPLKAWLDDIVMQQIAEENNLAETAFFVRSGADYHIRWMTPKVEVDLCGHATLAAAHCLFHHLGETRTQITFHSRSGPLVICRKSPGYEMDFPLDHPQQSEADAQHIQSICPARKEPYYRGKDDYLVIMNDEDEVRLFNPDLAKIAQLKARGLIISALGSTCDFVSRCFFPSYGIDEDPATGSAHTLLAPFWCQELGKTDLSARQLSTRVGEINCRLSPDRVYLQGCAITYMTGKIYI